MKKFFSQTDLYEEVTHGKATFNLPINYYRDDCFALYFTADTQKLIDLLPSRNLHPLTLPTGRSLYAIAVFNYIDTSIGPYGEVGAIVPVIDGEKPKTFTVTKAMLMESSFPGFGVFVQHLPVTKIEARDAGRGQWGYPKFIASMQFRITPEKFSCKLSEGEQSILKIKMMRKGIYHRENRSLISYSVKNNSLIKTVVPMKSRKRVALYPSGSALKLGDHPVSESIRELGLSKRPIMTVYYTERFAILPKGEVIEYNTDDYQGYIGKNKKAEHTVDYLG